MKLKNSYFYTLREDVKDEESISGNLLVRSGMIKKTSTGIYMFLPLGLRVIENLKAIIREEMNKKGALELSMPLLINEEFFDISGRKGSFGGEMFSLTDRNDKKYALGPTHEELFTVAAKSMVKSYKDLPFNLYQIGNKYRDEKRPRYGLIRVREFLMKDAYSFDADKKQNDESYKKMYDAYKNIFDRCKLEYLVCKSDTGAMGGELSEEFQAISSIGEDEIVSCKCGYATNIELATNYFEIPKNEHELEKEEVYTKDAKTIDDVCDYLSLNKEKSVKTLIYKLINKDECVMVLMCGNDELNEKKLEKICDDEIQMATTEEIYEICKTKPGFLGPIGVNIKVIADEKIKYMKNFCVGANKENYHFINVNLKDFDVFKYADLRKVKERDLCPICKKSLTITKGIEIGNIFKLGTKYSEAFDLTYLDTENKRQTVTMGCYGIGLGRVIAAVIEQHNDENGIIWPLELAPFKVAIVIQNTKDKKQMELALKYYEELQNKNVSVILDDRDERIGVKFKDMDLIGIPFRITIGKKIEEKLVEFKKRDEQDFSLVKTDKIIETIMKHL